MRLSFEWDPEKAISNVAKHGVASAEAQTVFADPLVVETPDPDHSLTEERFFALGMSYRGRLLVVAYPERGEHIRIISARNATRHEKRAYEDG